MTRREDVAKAEQALHDQVNLLPRRQLIAVFGIISLVTFITFIDQNGISTTLPIIAADLNAQNTISWAGTASLIANTTFQMLYGRLSDIFGRKTVFLTAVALLSVADLLCGLSQNAAMLYVFRAVAGVGGGGITNLAMIIVSDVVTLEQRGKYQGIIGSMVGLGNIVGPFAAAALASHTTWRAFFWMLAPLAALTGTLCYFYLPSKPREIAFSESVKKVDWLGTFMSSLGIIFLLIPISGGGAYFDWDSPMVISMLAIGGLSLILFVIVEWRVANLPMMPVEIYQNPIVSVILIQSFLFGAVYQSYLYYVPLYLQNAHQFGLIKSALIWVPLVAVQSIVSVLSGLYISKFKRYGEILWAGFGFWTLGAGLTLILERDSSIGIILMPLILTGFGVGCIFQPTLVALQAHSPKSRRAVIISNRNFYRCAGGACGLAISAAVLQARLRSALPAEYTYVANSTYSIPDFGDRPIPDEVLDAYMKASHAVFLLQVPIIGICLIGMAFIRDRGLEPIEDQVPTEPLATSERTRNENPTGNTDPEVGEISDILPTRTISAGPEGMRSNARDVNTRLMKH